MSDYVTDEIVEAAHAVIDREIGQSAQRRPNAPRATHIRPLLRFWKPPPR